MSYASAVEEEMGGLDLDQLPPEIRDQAKKEKRSQGGYRYDSAADKQHIKEQRAAIWAWFRGLGGNLIKHGVNLTKVPLPVELCEPRSFLQRLTDSWSYTDLLHAAAACSDPVERLKLVIAFAVGGMRQQLSYDKPFNPILGETLQGRYPCGCMVYAEQVSHHPPVSCWQFIDQDGKFEYYGSSCWSATFTGNSVKGMQYGSSQVRFGSDGAVVTWSLPTIHIRGVLFGDRVVKYHDVITFQDKNNNLRCELSIDPHAPKKGLVKRIIGKARHPRTKHVHDQLVGDVVRIGPKGQETVLDSLSGTWLSELSWDKGVRSTVMPGASLPVQQQQQPAAAAAQQAAAAMQQQPRKAAAVDDDAASVGCHSIGSFSSSISSSTVENDDEAGAADADIAAAEEQHSNNEAISSSSSSSEESSSSSSSSSRRLTAGVLAAHTQQDMSAASPVANGSGTAAAAATAAAATAAAAAEPAGCVTVGTSSDAAAHRSGRGISVVKKLWDVKTSQIWKFVPLPDDDPSLLPSDYRYRPDIQALAGGARHAAQHWKLVLEEKQRRDRTLRAQGGFNEKDVQHYHTHSSSSSSVKYGSDGELVSAGSAALDDNK